MLNAADHAYNADAARWTRATCAPIHARSRSATFGSHLSRDAQARARAPAASSDGTPPSVAPSNGVLRGTAGKIRFSP
eukprot:5148512-Pyramimonas_sp.AAC.1